MAGHRFHAALPDRSARLSLIGMEADLGHAPLLRSLGNGHIGRRHIVALHRHIRARHPQNEVASVGANGAGPNFHDHIRLLTFLGEKTA